MKKIIALIAVTAIILSVLNISAFATSEPSAMTSQEYYSAQSYLVDKWCNGDITYSQYQEQSQAVTDDFINSNTVGGVINSWVLNTSNTFNAVSNKIGSAVSQWGDGAREHVADWWNNVCNTNNVPTETTQTSTTDIKGYGALVVLTTIDRGYTVKSYAYCDYIIVYSENSSYLYSTIINNGSVGHYTNYWDGVLGSNYDVYSSNTASKNVDLVSVEYYGDVRYEDGTQAPTDDEFITGTLKKFDDMPEKDLEDLLNDFSEEMERQNPDLSSIEGLLNAIYARMGTLDSDNDNALLASINANILALLEADNKKDEDNTNEELVNTLLDIRDALKKGTLGTASSSHGHEIFGTLYNVKPLDKNWFNKIFHDEENLKVEYEGSTYYLEDCGCLKLGDRYYSVNMNYDTVDLIDLDFSSDDFEISVKFADDKDYSEIIDNLGTLRDLLPQNKNTRSGISTFSLGEEKGFFQEIFSHSQQRKINTVMGYVEDFLALGVPYESIQENLSTYEAIIFDNGYTPEDLKFTIFGEECTLLSYNSLTQSDEIWEDTSEYTSSLDVVKAFTSILISFWWVLSMYKKMSNLI